MSFIPPSGKQVIGASVGSGLTVENINDIDFLSLNLVAGPNVDIINSQIDNSVTIAVSGESGGIAHVISDPASGINTRVEQSTVVLSSALVGNVGIDILPGSGKNLLINNSHTFSSVTGGGIGITKTGDNFQFQSAFVGGNGIVLNPSNLTSNIEIENNGVLQLTSGPGILVTTSPDSQFSNVSPQNPLIQNTGIISLVSGDGINVEQLVNNPVITNTGVRSLTAGNGISVTTATGTPTIENTGILNVSSSTGILATTEDGIAFVRNLGLLSATATGAGLSAVTSNGALSLSNTGVVSLSAGSGIGVNTATGSPIITNTGIRSIIPGTGILTSGSNDITISAIPDALVAGQGIALTTDNLGNRVVTNIGVRSLTAGSNVTITGTPTIPIISASGLAPITNYIYQDSGLAIDAVGGISTSPNTFTAPETGLYIVDFTAVFANGTPAGGGGQTEVRLDPSSEFIFQLQNLEQPISLIQAEIGRVPILPTGVNVDATFLNKTATGILLAGRTYTFSVNLLNEPGTTTSWFSAEAGVKIIKLC
jgi:hypothetical protein